MQDTKKLTGKKIAILVADGFEQSEMTSPREAITEAGGTAEIVSPKTEKVKGWKHTEWGDSFPVDKALADIDAREYDGLLLPGGLMNPDTLRQDGTAVAFVRHFFDTGKPVAAICHGPWMLIEAGAARDRKVTSYPSIKTDLLNAGAEWVDEEVVVDRGLVTSRSPKDLDAFNAKAVEEFCEGYHAAQEMQTASS